MFEKLFSRNRNEKNELDNAQRVARALSALPEVCRECPWRSKESGGTGECDQINAEYGLLEKLVSNSKEAVQIHTELSKIYPLRNYTDAEELTGESVQDVYRRQHVQKRRFDEIGRVYGLNDGPDRIAICAISLARITNKDGDNTTSMLDATKHLVEIRDAETQFVSRTRLDYPEISNLARRLNDQL